MARLELIRWAWARRWLAACSATSWMARIVCRSSTSRRCRAARTGTRCCVLPCVYLVAAHAGDLQCVAVIMAHGSCRIFIIQHAGSRRARPRHVAVDAARMDMRAWTCARPRRARRSARCALLPALGSSPRARGARGPAALERGLDFADFSHSQILQPQRARTRQVAVRRTARGARVAAAARAAAQALSEPARHARRAARQRARRPR